MSKYKSNLNVLKSKHKIICAWHIVISYIVYIYSVIASFDNLTFNLPTFSNI